MLVDIHFIKVYVTNCGIYKTNIIFFIDTVCKQVHTNSSLHLRCVVKQVYRRTQGEHVGFKMFSDDFLLSLTRKVRLPDVEFVNNLGDWPLEHKDVADNPLPIFSWCGSDDTRDIVMPTYDVTESTLETLGR